jgi:hypothetical protein
MQTIFQQKAYLGQKNKSLSTVVQLFLILVLALIIRVFVLTHSMKDVNSDEAIVGLMAHHILNGERPLFYYGQVYYGPLDAYLTAPVFAFFGSDYFTLRVVPLISSLLFVWAVFLLGKNLYSESAGLLAALYVAVGPPFLIERGLKADAAYSLILLFGTFSLILAHSIFQQPSRKKIISLAFLSLSGLWVFPLMLYYILSICIVGFGFLPMKNKNTDARILPNPVRNIILIVSLFIFVGAIFLSKTVSGIPVWQKAVEAVTGLFDKVVPIMLGLTYSSNMETPFTLSSLSAGQVFQIIACLCNIFVLVGGVILGFRWARRGEKLLFVFSTLTLLLFSVFYIFVGVTPKILSIPRYLFPLYSAVPMWAAAFLALTRNKNWLRYSIIIVILVANLFSNLTLPALYTRPPELVTWFLNRPGKQYVYTDYWTGYKLAFDSQEKVIPFITNGDRPGNNRYQPYLNQVLVSGRPIYIYQKGMEGEMIFLTYLDQNQVDYQATEIDTFTVYWDLSRPIHVTRKGFLISPNGSD